MLRLTLLTFATITFSLAVYVGIAQAQDTRKNIDGRNRSTVGASGRIGYLNNPQRVERLSIKKPGVYEDYLVDGRWVEKNLVKINADDVTLRNCEIRNGKHNAVTVYGKNVVIENCTIHHMLKGTAKKQNDAHGITGQPNNLTIRNCEIYYVSGDSVQFDPGRGPWDNVLIENCTFWTGPLPANAAGYKKGERPGENAFDSKTPSKGSRPKITMRNCLMYGWNQPGTISLLAALNLKENVHAEIENCVFRDNQVCFRLRGPTRRGGAEVTIKRCAIFQSAVGVRMEDGIENLKILGIGFGKDVARKFRSVSGKPRGLVIEGVFQANSYEATIQKGVTAAGN
jgi:hypothetical protein